jgi:pseudaminic acid synthase
MKKKKNFFKKLNYPFLIAEISANHNGSLNNCFKLIENAKKNGADAVKIQTYKPDSMTINSKRKEFIIKEGLWKNYSLWNLFEKAQTPYQWHKAIFDYCKKIKIMCFSSAFDQSSIDLLENLNCPIYKIASFEMTDFSLLHKISKTKKPVIISTGLSNLKEITDSVSFLKKNGTKEIAILYCVSSYPAKDDEFNLRNIKILIEKFNCVVGFSDHSNNVEIAKLAYAMGARIFEKHIALEKQTKGFDIKFSLKGKELISFKNELLKTKKILGKKIFHRNKNELKNLKFRRSIYAIEDIKKNQKFTEKNIKTIRPNSGLSPKFFFKILNKKSKKNIKKGSPIKINFF